jgi:hypothetical protein
VESGDLVMPFEKIDLRARPFSPAMQASGLAKGVIVAAKSVLTNFGSTSETTGVIARVGGH